MEIEAVQELEIETEKVGPQGYSAYEVAVQNGFEGTEEEWLESLKGADGTDGEPGPQGPQGLPGEDGANATINGVSAINIAAGENITLDQEEGTLTINSTGGGTRDYTALTNKPSINNVELNGNKSLSDLGAGTYDKPASGIPKTDLASDVQASLDKADSALQSYTEQYTGTITGITMNGASKGTSGVVDLGTIITEHQDISGKQDVLTAGDNITINNNNVISSSIKQYVFDNSDTQENKLKVLNDFYHSYKKGETNALAVKKQIGNYPKMVLMSPSYVTPTRMEFGESYTSFPSSSTNTYGIKYKYFLYVNLTLTIDETNDVVTDFNISNNTLGFFPDDINYLLGMTNTNAYTPTGDYNPATKKYVDDNKGQTIQYETMPTASADYLGKIVQYTGTTNANYTNGYFYVCVSETENDVTTYSWSNVEVQSVSDYLKFEKKDAPTISDSIMLCKLPTGFYEIDGYCRVNQDFSSKTRRALVSVYSVYSNAKIWIWNKDTSVVEYYACNTYGYGSTNDVKVTLDVNTLATKSYTTLNTLELSGLSAHKTTTTYQINDYVYHLDNDTYKIYKCNTADTKGTWNAAKWDEKTYMEYLSDTLVGGALNGSY